MTARDAGMRLPQVGERWRLRIRNEEMEACPCGYVPGDRMKKFNEQIVTVVSSQGGAFCGNCERRVLGDFYFGVLLPESSSPHAAFPYTWLEPLDYDAKRLLLERGTGGGR